ncbi:hypothetical protein CXB51_028925 [Gossypium anomalum]|uniref:GAG-pre-integrase domain-containing protein n=1 Tax=Gossypium anomalum TaxID=47600 RepID=A0A8J6CPX8_9ROSI|nr:hypothetical protein CXB51_028925 [Gossypium anomalum]
MKDLLFVKALHLSVFTTQKPDSKSDEEWEFEHQQVCGFIREFVEENIYNHIDQETHTRTLWEKLESLYASRSGNNKLFLLKKMMALKYKERLEEDLRVLHHNPMCWLSRTGGGTETKMERVEIKAKTSQDRDTRILSVIIVVRKAISRNIASSGRKRTHDRNDDEKFERVATVTREDLLVIYDKNFVNLMGNDGLVLVIGMGDVSLVSNNGTKLALKDVRHAPNIRWNLISAGKLDDEGFCNTFKMVNVTVNDSSTELWHKRLSHMSEKRLNYLARKNQLLSLKNATLKNCAHCLAGKQRRVLFRIRPPRRRSELLELVHSDDCGLIKFQASVEREAGKKLKCIRTNNGGEYTGSFHEYCDVQDRVWFGKDVSYDYLCVFGCKAFVHVPKDERSKLDAKTRQSIFIGYGLDGEFGYRLYDLVQKKLMRSRDVVFIEDQTIDDIDKTKKVDSQDSGDLIDVNPISLDSSPDPIQDDVHGDVSDDHQDICDFDTPMDDVVNDQQQAIIAPPAVPLRRSSRDRRSSVRYSSDEYVLLTDGGEPECYEKAMESKRALKNRWIYRLKQEEKSSSPRYKARLVVKGYTQKNGVDFEEIFSSVVKMSSIRTILSLAVCYDLEVEQMDVKTAFLHGNLEEELYMDQLEGFVAQGKEDYVCRLKKSLYGLKQAPRQWYKKFESIMREQGYKKTTSDHCVFVKRFSGDDFIILLLYVDDMLIVGQNASRI